ncbi:MAG: hypothetical protein QM731_27500 [Chitinophagaceae bacterium]
MKCNITLSVLASVMLLISCSKHKDCDHPVADKKELLRRIEWPSASASGELKYDTDSTLLKIIYTTSTGNSEIGFTYDNKGRVEQIASAAMGKYADYAYDNKDRVSHIFLNSDYSTSSIVYEFTYDAGNKVSTLKYWIANGTGTKLQWSSTYQYNAEGLVNKVISVSNNSTVTYTLENYSDVLNFNPWAYIYYLDVAEMYELYNYPVLSRANKFPGKITQATSSSGTIQKVIENTYTIQNKRLDKTTVKITYPPNPQYNTQYDIKYFY